MQSAQNKKEEPVDLDTALSIAGLGKFQFNLIFLIGGCIGSATMDNLGTSFVLPDVACELEISVVEKGLLSGATYSGMMLTGYFWGFLSDTYGRRGSLLASLGFSWLASFSASLAPVFWLLVALRFLAGAGIAGMASTIFAYMVEFLPPKARTKYLSWGGTFIGVSFCLMPAIAWPVLPLTWTLDLGFVVIKSWRILSLLNGSLILVTFFGMLWFPESPKYLLSVDKDSEALEVLRKIFALNTGRPANEYPVHAIKKTFEDIRTVEMKESKKLTPLQILKKMKDQIVPIFGMKYLRGTILGCILQFSIFASSCGFYLWMPDILNNIMSYDGKSPNSTTVCNALNTRPAPSPNDTCDSEISPTVYVSSLVAGGSYCVGYLLLALFANAVNQKTLLAILQFISGIAALGLILATDVISIGLLSTLYMLPAEIAITLLSSMMSDLYPTHLRSGALCIALAIGRLGASLYGFVIGVLLEYDCTSTIIGMGGLSIASGLLCFFMPSPEKGTDSVT